MITRKKISTIIAQLPPLDTTISIPNHIYLVVVFFDLWPSLFERISMPICVAADNLLISLVVATILSKVQSEKNGAILSLQFIFFSESLSVYDIRPSIRFLCPQGYN